MTRKIGVSLPDDRYLWATQQVEQGAAESVSALVTQGLAVLQARAELQRLVEDLESEIGELDADSQMTLDEALQAADEAAARPRRPAPQRVAPQRIA